MTDGIPVAEQERTIATVAQCQLQLRWAQQQVREACELLRRAIRTADTAEAELHTATQRLGRLEPSTARVS